VHVVAVWSLLMYFVLVQEPAAHDVAVGGAADPGGIGFSWRWRQLGGGAKGALGSFASGWGVQIVVSPQYSIFFFLTRSQPFFWAFVTLELVLHSLRIFSGFVSTSFKGIGYIFI
jgi:hypothetical protein